MTPVATTQENKVEILQGQTLTREITLAIQNCILSGNKYYYMEDRTIRLPITKEDGTVEEIRFSARTYDSWIAREMVIPDTKQTLKELVEATRQKYLAIKEKKADEQRIRQSERTLDYLLQLPIHDTKVERTIKRNKNGKLEEVKRVTTKEISAPLVGAKVKGLTFTLERLNPQKYGEKGEVKHSHVIFSLADLRKHREELKKQDAQ